MRKLYILNDGRTVVTENAEFGSPVGIKEVHDISSLSDEEFQDLLVNRLSFTPVTDAEGNLTKLTSPQRTIKLTQEQNI